MPYGAGRNTEFVAQAGRQSELGEMKERYEKLAASAGYEPRSVLDMPRSGSGIGLSTNDRTRQLLNGQLLPSRNGISTSTYDKRQALGLDSMYRAV